MSLTPVADIQAIVAQFYKIPRRKMTEHDQSYEATRPRSIAMYLARELTEKSLGELGRRFNRDRKTIHHALAIVSRRAATDPQVAADLAALRERLGA